MMIGSIWALRVNANRSAAVAGVYFTVTLGVAAGNSACCAGCGRSTATLNSELGNDANGYGLYCFTTWLLKQHLIHRYGRHRQRRRCHQRGVAAVDRKSLSRD